MHDPANVLPRIYLLGSRVNKGKEKGRGLPNVPGPGLVAQS
jgi:hypothetical protein